MNFEIKDLQMVRYLAENGSISATAGHMHISQPAVSQRLSNLHKRIGISLFERRDGLLQLTLAGKRVLTTANIINDELLSTTGYIEGLTQQRHDRLRITTQCYTCYRWLPFVLREMRLQFPKLNVDVVPEATDAPFIAIEEDRLDIAIVSHLDPAIEIKTKKLFADELYAVMSSGHPLAKSKYLSPEQFAEETLIVYTGNKHAILEEILYPAGIEPAHLIQVRITEAIVELARAGQGIAILSGWAFTDLDNSEGLSKVRITKSGFLRTWKAAINQRGIDVHSDALIKTVRRIGKAIKKPSWRQTLQGEYGRANPST